MTDFALKLFARALYKDPFVFKGLKQLHDAAHVVGDRLTHAFHILFGNHRAHAVVREKLGQNGAVNHPGDDVHAAHAVTDRLKGKVEVVDVFGVDAFVADQFFGLCGREFRGHDPVRTNACNSDLKNEFVGLDGRSDGRGDVFGREVKTFARGGKAEGAHEHDKAPV